MTAVELLIVYIVLAGIIWVLVGISRHVRDSAKQKQAVQLMSALSDAMALYQLEEKAFPPVSRDGDATTCLRLLASKSKSRRALQEELPDRWRAQLGADTVWLDPWGTPLRYVDGSAIDETPDGRRMPYLETAGKDRDFGGPTRDALVRSTDNLRTDEPMPEETKKTSKN